MTDLLLLASGALIGPNQQLLLFALAAAAAAAVLMARPVSASSASTETARWWLLPPQGFAVVPSLVLLGRLPMSLASGTSLLVIAASSLMALLAHGEWSVEGFRLLFPLLIGGGFGVLLGQRLAPQLPEQRLRQGFAALLLVSAVSSGVEALQPRDAHAVQLSVLNEPSPHR